MFDILYIFDRNLRAASCIIIVTPYMYIDISIKSAQSVRLAVACLTSFMRVRLKGSSLCLTAVVLAINYSPLIVECWSAYLMAEVL